MRIYQSIQRKPLQNHSFPSEMLNPATTNNNSNIIAITEQNNKRSKKMCNRNQMEAIYQTKTLKNDELVHPRNILKETDRIRLKKI